MLITLRDKNDNLLVKDMLDIDFDMSIGKENGKFYVLVNHNLKSNEKYDSQEDAEEAMLAIAESRNALESELRGY